MIGRRSFLTLAAAGMAAPGFALAQDAPAKKDPLAGKNPLADRFGGPFSMSDHNGNRVSEKTYLGQFMLIYFGFTRCIDACPIDVPNLVNALDLIKPLDARVQPLFVTVDPSDTVTDMKEYVEAFHPRLVGLTGTEAEIAAIAKVYRVHRLRLKLDSELQSPAPTTRSADLQWTGPRHAVPRAAEMIPVHGDKPHSPTQRFSINHGTLTYLMGPDGKFVSMVPHASAPEKIAQVLRKYITA
jgi:protein SCO1